MNTSYSAALRQMKNEDKLLVRNGRVAAGSVELPHCSQSDDVRLLIEHGVPVTAGDIKALVASGAMKTLGNTNRNFRDVPCFYSKRMGREYALSEIDALVEDSNRLHFKESDEAGVAVVVRRKNGHLGAWTPNKTYMVEALVEGFVKVGEAYPFFAKRRTMWVRDHQTQERKKDEVPYATPLWHAAEDWTPVQVMEAMADAPKPYVDQALARAYKNHPNAERIEAPLERIVITEVGRAQKARTVPRGMDCFVPRRCGTYLVGDVLEAQLDGAAAIVTGRSEATVQELNSALEGLPWGMQQRIAPTDPENTEVAFVFQNLKGSYVALNVETGEKAFVSRHHGAKARPGQVYPVAYVKGMARITWSEPQSMHPREVQDALARVNIPHEWFRQAMAVANEAYPLEGAMDSMRGEIGSLASVATIKVVD